MFRFVVGIAVVALPMALVAAQLDEGPPRWMANLARKQQVIMSGIPEPYAAATDESSDTPTKIRQGAAVFERHCASCHGLSGQGSGPEAFAMVPAPADLEWLARTPKNKSGPYMYWSIAEGGKPFDSEMPAYKQTLSQEDIWSVIAYVRSGFWRRESD